jgi:hypothetical protein
MNQARITVTLTLPTDQPAGEGREDFVLSVLADHYDDLAAQLPQALKDASVEIVEAETQEA